MSGNLTGIKLIFGMEFCRCDDAVLKLQRGNTIINISGLLALFIAFSTVSCIPRKPTADRELTGKYRVQCDSSPDISIPFQTLNHFFKQSNNQS